VAKPRNSGGNGLLWEKKPDPHEIHWAHIGHARRGVALAAIDIPREGARLFCATADGTLWCRNLARREERWQAVAQGCGATSLTAVTVPGAGPKLFASRDNLVYVRDATPEEAPWHLFGEAGGVIALAALNLPGAGARLFCVTRDNLLYRRDAAIPDAAWQMLGEAADVCGLAALQVPGEGPQLFCATSDHRLYRRDAATPGLGWTHIGRALNVVAMTAASQRLLCLTPGEEIKLKPLPHQIFLPVRKQVQITVGVSSEEARRLTVVDEFGNCHGCWAGAGEQLLGATHFRAEQGSTPGVVVMEVLCERQHKGDPAWYGSRCTVNHHRGGPQTPEELIVAGEDCWVKFQWQR
jgi:hypothetical protein